MKRTFILPRTPSPVTDQVPLRDSGLRAFSHSFDGCPGRWMAPVGLYQDAKQRVKELPSGGDSDCCIF